MKKKITAIVLVVVVLAMLFTGLTMAYFTDTDSAENVMVMGNVKIEQHEQQRDETGKLEDFEQNKPLLPVVENPDWDNDGDGKDAYTENGYNIKYFDDAQTNVIDKIVTVENTGSSDAYIRTIIAIEKANKGESGDEDWVHINHTAALGSAENEKLKGDYIGVAEIGGQYYDLLVYTYKTVIKPNEITMPSLMQVYLDAQATQEYAAGFGPTFEILVLSQAVQADGFAGLGVAAEYSKDGADDAKYALDKAFGKITTTDHPWVKGVTVSTNEELKTALAANEENIVVYLAADVTYDVAAWAANGMGGASTETITINGNGHTLNFYQTNSDWNNVVTQDAMLILNNVNLTNSGHNDGPWNRHDINFACEVEMNNVSSDKALAFKRGAALTDVTIDDANTSDTYAIWIQPNGQIVTLDGCTIDMVDCTDGRGIKIDEQYVTTPAKVTLVVKNTKFATEEKSAILVKSAAGADITLEDVDISSVAADTTNAVWVDSDAAASYDLVTVTGGSKVQE